MRRRRPMEKTLFLDFDGVLHPSFAKEGAYFSHANRLAETIGNHSCEIVISSSWRFSFELQKLKEHLPSRLARHIVATTGDAWIGPLARYNEILEYLRMNPCRDWRALDDSTFEFPAKCAELIVCKGSRGLDSQVLALLEAWLRD